MRRGYLYIVTFMLALVASPALGQWVEFVDETATRIDTTQDPNSGASVVETNVDEKDYAWGDLDKDGDIDLVGVYKQPETTAGRRRNVLLMNEGGVLVDRTTQFASASTVTLQGGGTSQGFLDLTNDRDVILADVNGDTWLDVITATTLSGGPGGTVGDKAISHPRIYINQQDDPPGSGNWQGLLYDDVNRIPTFAAEPRFCALSAGDIDGDLDEDLYFADYQQPTFQPRPVDLNDQLLLNDGNGFFTNVSSSRMTFQMRNSSFGTASAFLDMNGDGRLDIIKSTGLTDPLHVSISYNNNDGGAGEDGFFDAFDIVYSLSAYHFAVGDLNNDNLPDIAISDDNTDRYLLNNGNGPDGLAEFPVTSLLIGSIPNQFGSNNFIADLNKDGFNDVLVANFDVDDATCFQPSKIFRNFGLQPDNFNVTLQEDGNAGIPQSVLNGVHDFAVFDINGDTWLDLVIGECGGTSVYMNAPPTQGLQFNYPDGLPIFLPEDQLFTFRVSVSAPGVGGDPDDGTGVMFLSTDGGPFSEVAMEQESPNVYFAKFPPGDCPQRFQFYFSADRAGAPFTDPALGATAPFEAFVAEGSARIIDDHIEGDVSDWTIINDPGLTSGAWEQADPIQTANAGATAAPGEDAEAALEEVMAFVTENCPNPGCAAGGFDIDGGGTELISPLVDLDGTNGVISYFRWFYTSASTPGIDTLTVWVANDGDQPAPTWVLVETVEGTSNGNDTAWEGASFLVSDFVAPTANVRVRFRAEDAGAGSIVEAGVDLFGVDAFSCPVGGEPCDCPGDVSDDTFVNGADVQGFVDCMLGGGANCGCADIDPGIGLDMNDVNAFVGELLTGPGCS